MPGLHDTPSKTYSDKVRCGKTYRETLYQISNNGKPDICIQKNWDISFQSRGNHSQIASQIAPATLYNGTSDNNETTKDNKMDQSSSTPTDKDAEESTQKQTDQHVPETQPEVHASAVST